MFKLKRKESADVANGVRKTTKTFQVKIFWSVMQRSVAVGYQRFGGPCCLHLQSDDGDSMIIGRRTGLESSSP